ncbi:MAG TPA: hypothetical protein VES88_09865 [Gemmatimonadaceae bacterium]|nr:hypothetical protein [Gemmatimonadaceae bacterium]
MPPSNIPTNAGLLAEQLMAMDSTSGREGAVIVWIESLLRGAGWITGRIPVSLDPDDLYARSIDGACSVTLSY